LRTLLRRSRSTPPGTEFFPSFRGPTVLLASLVSGASPGRVRTFGRIGSPALPDLYASPLRRPPPQARPRRAEWRGGPTRSGGRPVAAGNVSPQPFPIKGSAHQLFWPFAGQFAQPNFNPAGSRLQQSLRSLTGVVSQSVLLQGSAFPPGMPLGPSPTTRLKHLSCPGRRGPRGGPAASRELTAWP
jgi:hypothetical protein